MQKARIMIKNNIPVLILALICLVTRLVNITELPIFTDESIYIYWAKVIQSTHSQWFISLTDGKPPLLVWMTGGFLQFLPDSMYLLAGRLPSVIAGVLSVVAIYKLTEILFRSQKMAIVAGVLYIIHPFLLMYDRLALFDSLLSCMLLWSTYFAVRTFKTLKWTDAVFWGIFLGLAFLSKPTALMFWVLLPFCIGVLAWREPLIKNFRKIVTLSAIALILSQLIQAIERISSVYFRMAEKNSQFQYSVSELISDPIIHSQSNLNGLFSWFISYNTIPVFLIGIVAMIFLGFKKPREGLVLFILWFIPMLGLAVIGKEIFPRYILFITPYFLIPIAYLLVKLWEEKVIFKAVSVIASIIILFSLIPYSFAILTSPEKAPIPGTDYRQLVSEHPSGYGLDSVFDYLDQESKDKKIVVVTQGTFGLYPYAFTLRYFGNPNVEIVPKWPLTSADDVSSLNKDNTFVILKESEVGDIPPELPLTLIFKAQKPDGRYPILVTRPNQ